MGFVKRWGVTTGSLTLLGEGISGKVELFESKSTCYVIKTYHDKEKFESRKEYKDRVLHEYHLLASLDHPNFLKVLKSEVSFNGHSIKMYMEAGSQDLGGLILKKGKSLNPSDALCLWKQICQGVQYLHRKNLCHRDLKLENIVMDRDFATIKIIDLMTSIECNGPVFGIVGSARYMAPEMASKISYEGKSVDIWSIGIILYYLMTRAFPWRQAIHSDPVYKTYTNKEWSLPRMNLAGMNEKWCSEKELLRCESSLDLVISRTLEVDPNDRYDMEKLLADDLFKWIQPAPGLKFFQSGSTKSR